MQSLESIPAWLSDTWSISLESAQILLSVSVIFCMLLPVMYLARGSKAVFIEIVVFFLAEALLVGIGWLPFWIMIATVAIMAVGIAILGTKGITGG